MKKLVRMLLLLLLPTIFVSCADSVDEERLVRVMLGDTEHMTVTGENPVLVRAGEDAAFSVELEDGYAVTELSDGAVYENGSVVLKNVEYPTTLTATAKVPRYYLFEYRYSSTNGSVETSLPADKYMEGTEITIKASPNDGMYFLGFSRNDYLTNGGFLVSLSDEYSFSLKENVTLYANYADPDDYLLIYHANGGVVVGSDSDITCSQNSAEFYLCPNTLQLKGYFEKDGYVLLGYNTEPDGSGRYYGCGWNVVVDETGTEELYCVWAKISPTEDFKYAKVKNTVKITGYTGNDDFVVIPETIDGLPVTQIAKNAFKDCDLRSVYLTKNVEGFAADAFKNCKNLESVYLTDNIVQADDGAFAGCDNFKTLYINSALDLAVVYAEFGNSCVKFEQLMASDPNQKKLVVISGSSSLYGLTTPLLEEALDDEYHVVNYGIHAGTPCVFFMELAAAFTNPGDIVVNAPEPGYSQWGSNDFNMTLWQILECSLDAVSYVDISHFETVFSSFAELNRSRKKTVWGATYDYYDPIYSNDGDLLIDRPNQSDDFVTWYSGVLNFKLDFHQEENIANFNRAVALLRETGAECLISYSPVNVNALGAVSKTKSTQQRYEDSVKANFDSIVISNLSDYIMSGRYFYNTDLHLNTEGSAIRTARLAEDIKAWLATRETD